MSKAAIRLAYREGMEHILEVVRVTVKDHARVCPCDICGVVIPAIRREVEGLG